MGEVYRAHDARLGRDVAVKVLPEKLARDAEARARFEREARAVAALSHPNVLHIHDVGSDESQVWVVTELLEGETLADLLARRSLSEAEALDLARQMIDGVASAHDAGLVHRDLKPANLFITPGDDSRAPRLKILDFGLAKGDLLPAVETDEDATLAAHTQPGTVMGTVGYMSPEQAEGRETGARADVFAVGAVLYEMWTGQRAFTGSSPMAIVSAILRDQPSIAALPPAIARIVERCLAKEPEERYASANEVAGALAAARDPSPASGATVTGPHDPQSTRPSIAVLPFESMSGDPEQEFFADGITEDIITELSRIRSLFVIARNSSFAYKGKAVNIPEVARELGVRYVAEGSVRKAGNRVRITVQLIEAATGSHIWAERYDRDLEDVFAIQDEVARAITATLPGRLEAADLERAERKPPENLAAYECVLTGKILHHRVNKEDNAEALRLLDRAIELDPQYAHAHAWKACVLGQASFQGFVDDREAALTRAEEALQAAYTLDDSDAECHRLLSAVNLASRQYDKAAHHQERGLALNPNSDLIVVQQGELFTWTGRPDEGVEWIRKAMRLNPYHPERFWNHLGRALFVARRYDEAIEAFRRIAIPDHTHHAYLAACHAQLGNRAEAERHAAEATALCASFSIDEYLSTLPYQHEADLQHHREALIKAGLPD
jgi:TolB-like protein/tRNA A-37 threonylcarbamoyl transferase component Bud32/Tfp pilus assembly protein PilF